MEVTALHLDSAEGLEGVAEVAQVVLSRPMTWRRGCQVDGRLIRQPQMHGSHVEGRQEASIAI